MAYINKIFMKLQLAHATLLIAIALVLLFPGGIQAGTGAEKNSLPEETPVLYYFWGYCPLCDAPDENLVNIQEYPVEIKIFEVVYNAENREKFHEMREEIGIESMVFPTTIINEQYWLGFSPMIEDEIIQAIEYALYETEVKSEMSLIYLPLIGEIDLYATPIMFTTVLIGFLDGFNPCSIFVLTFLLAIIVHSASRGRIIVVGLTFLIVTTLVYGLFILGALNIMIFASQLFWIRNVVAGVVIVLGLFSIKDYFVLKKGISFSIPDSYKAKYYQQVRNIFYTKSIIPMILATAVMALGIALIELPCTAGFPFIWTSIVSGLELPLSQYILLFIIYLSIYLSVELIIFLLAVVRMRTMKLTEERGRFLKLSAGCLMFVLGLVLILKPEYMENILGIIVAFGAAALMVITLYFIRTVIMAKA